MSGMEIVERLVNRDEDAQDPHLLDRRAARCPSSSTRRRSPWFPPGDGSRVSWSVSTEPDDAAAFIRDVYAGALEALKGKVEG